MMDGSKVVGGLLLSGLVALQLGCNAPVKDGSESTSSTAQALGPLWTQEAKLVPTVAPGDWGFGMSASLSGDTALVGDPRGWPRQFAYVFVRGSAGFVEQARLSASDNGDLDAFGEDVAVSGDTALVGAYRNSERGHWSGAAYVFVRSGSTWTQQAKLTASDAVPEQNFGWSVGLSGDTAVVGAPHGPVQYVEGCAYVFVRSGSTWTQQAKLTSGEGPTGDAFGRAVSVSGDTALVGAPIRTASNYNGAAFVFVRSGTSWTRQAKLVASDGADQDAFGEAVSISGNTAVVGAWGSDPVGIYSGSAYAFVRSGSTWTQQQKLLGASASAEDRMGSSVSVSGDYALVGGIDDDSGFGGQAGVASLYTRSGGTWTEQTIRPNDPRSARAFGAAVSISGDTALITSTWDSADVTRASAYVFVPGTKTVGAACAKDAECTSTFCVDGVCCDTSCGGNDTSNCLACSVAAGAAVNGTCGRNTQNASCSGCVGDQGCPAGFYCGADGQCVARKAQGAACNLGAGADCRVEGCRACESGFCADGVCCDTACQGNCETCAAPIAGTCALVPDGAPPAKPANTPLVCGGLLCDGTSSSCPKTCATDADCDRSYRCLTPTCSPRRPLGDPCANGGECASGYCSRDRVCASTVRSTGPARGGTIEGSGWNVGGSPWREEDGGSLGTSGATSGSSGASGDGGAAAIGGTAGARPDAATPGANSATGSESSGCGCRAGPQGMRHASVLLAMIGLLIARSRQRRAGRHRLVR
jgi:hypothetical protein